MVSDGIEVPLGAIGVHVLEKGHFVDVAVLGRLGRQAGRDDEGAGIDRLDVRVRRLEDLHVRGGVRAIRN